MPRNSRLSSIAAVAAFFLSVAAASAASVIFVDKDATGPVHDGTSWCQAYTSLSEAINVVEPGYTIRVANGTYKPDSAGLEDPRHASFPLQTGVRIEGGYAGCGAPDPDARNLALYETILDGDTKDDDSPPIESDCFEDHEGLGCDNEACEAIVCAREPDCCESELPSAIWFGYCAAAAKTYCCEQFGHHCDNTYHVVTAIGTDESAVLDGFTVTGGFAGGASGNARRGGGVNLEGASSTFATCTISGNASISYGGGIHIDGGSPTFEDCDIAANISHSSGGGGVRTTWAAPVFTRCTTTDNHALSHGGGLSLGYQTYATASHCTLARNTTESSGGAIYTYSAALSLTDTLIADNSGRLSAGMYASFSTVAIRNSKIVGNGMSGPTAGIGGIHARYSDVTIISSLIAGNVGSGNGGLGASYSVVDISVTVHAILPALIRA